MDKLYNKLTPSDDNQPDKGVNPYELPNIPEDQRKILQIILRRREISYAELNEALEALPESERSQIGDLDKALEGLSQEGHILCLIEGTATTYKANLRRKSGRNLMIKGLWDVLDSASEKVDKEKTRSTLAQKLYGGLEDKPEEKKDPDSPPPPSPMSEKPMIPSPREGE